MALELNGTTGVSLVQDGVVTAADLASGAITASALPAGSVLQVVSDTLTTNFDTTSSSYVEITGLNATITPSSASNKVLIQIQLMGIIDASGSSYGHQMRVDRNGTDTFAVGDASGSRERVSMSLGGQDGQPYSQNTSFVFLDSPSSTSALTYKVYTRHVQSQLQNFNRARVNSDIDRYYCGISTITLMEIAG